MIEQIKRYTPLTWRTCLCGDIGGACGSCDGSGRVADTAILPVDAIKWAVGEIERLNAQNEELREVVEAQRWEVERLKGLLSQPPWLLDAELSARVDELEKWQAEAMPYLNEHADQLARTEGLTASVRSAWCLGSLVKIEDESSVAQEAEPRAGLPPHEHCDCCGPWSCHICMELSAKLAGYAQG